MKTIIFKSILIIAVILGLSNYVIYLKTGTSPIDKLPDVNPSSLIPNKDTVSNVVNKVRQQTSSSSDQEKVYKWTDAEGNVHYSSAEPTQSATVKEVKVNPNANIVKRFQAPKEERKLSQDTVPTHQEIVPNPSSTYNPETIQQLIKDAKEVQTLMNERNEKIDAALDSL